MWKVCIKNIINDTLKKTHKEINEGKLFWISAGSDWAAENSYRKTCVKDIFRVYRYN